MFFVRDFFLTSERCFHDISSIFWWHDHYAIIYCMDMISCADSARPANHWLGWDSSCSVFWKSNGCTPWGCLQLPFAVFSHCYPRHVVADASSVWEVPEVRELQEGFDLPEKVPADVVGRVPRVWGDNSGDHRPNGCVPIPGGCTETF